MTSHGSSSALAARGHLGKVVCDSLSTVGQDWHTPPRVPPSVMIGNSLVFPVAAPTAFPIVTESAGLRHDPLEEGSERGEAGVALTDRDRIEEGRMPGFMTFILLMHVSAGLLTASLAVPLMRRKVGPNALYGFRVRRTLEDPSDLVRCQCVRREVPLPVRDRDRPRLPGPLLGPRHRPDRLCGGMPHDLAGRPRRGPGAQLPAPRPPDPILRAMTRPGSSPAWADSRGGEDEP